MSIIRSFHMMRCSQETAIQELLVISQYLTEGIFRDHLAKRGVHVELATEPVALEQDADAVTVTLKKVDANGEEKTEVARFSYVIGADGARGRSDPCKRIVSSLI